MSSNKNLNTTSEGRADASFTCALGSAFAGGMNETTVHGPRG